MRYKTYELDTVLDVVSVVHEGDDRTQAILCAEDLNEREQEAILDELIKPGMSEEELEALKVPRCTDLLGITWDTETGKLVYWEDHDAADFPEVNRETKIETETRIEN